MRRLLIAMIAASLAAPAHSQTECRITGRPQAYTFTADTVERVLTVPPGHSCVRGFRQFDATIKHVEVVNPPTGGSVTFEGTAFYYQSKPDFRGTDAFAFRITGERLGVSGSSTIDVTIVVK